MTDPAFQMFHLYRRLVRRGLVKQLKHHCGTEFNYGMGENDELVLFCFACDTSVVPGAETLGNVRAVVKEHFPDD